MPYQLCYGKSSVAGLIHALVLFGLILYVPVNNFSVMSDGSSWVEPVLSSILSILLKDTTQ